MLHVALHGGLVELATDQSLGVENCVRGVDSDLVLGRVSDQTLCVGERHVGRGGAITLVVGNNLHLSMLEHTNTRVGGTEIDSYGNFLRHFSVSSEGSDRNAVITLE